jgi:hypothetical protein
MVTVHRAHGFRFVIFTNDHAPAHVHVFGQGGEARIVLDDRGVITVDWVGGITRGDLHKIVEETRRERKRLMAMWRTIHAR